MFRFIKTIFKLIWWLAKIPFTVIIWINKTLETARGENNTGKLTERAMVKDVDIWALPPETIKILRAETNFECYQGLKEETVKNVINIIIKFNQLGYKELSNKLREYITYLEKSQADKLASFPLSHARAKEYYYSSKECGYTSKSWSSCHDRNNLHFENINESKRWVPIDYIYPNGELYSNEKLSSRSVMLYESD